MKLFVLFAQFRESYPEENAPEAIAVQTEFDAEANFGSYLEGKLQAYENDKNYIAARIVEFEVDQYKIRELLLGGTLKAKLIG